MSSFGGYSIAQSGMYVSTLGLNVTGQNISNANSTGYVRQQAMLSEVHSKCIGFDKQLGMGADIEEVRQIRDKFLDNMYRGQNKELGYWEGKNMAISDIESVIGVLTSFGSVKSPGMKEAMNEFFDSWQELSKEPDSLTTRALVTQKATSFVETINYVEELFDDIQSEMNEKIKISVNRINEISERIAELNEEIMGNEVSGDNANDFRDERNTLIDELSYLVDIETYEKSNNMVDIYVGGAILVNATKYETMGTDSNFTGSSFDNPIWDKSENFVELSGGYIRGLIEGRGEVLGKDGSIENGSPIETGFEIEDIEADLLDPFYNFDPQTENIIPEIKRGLNSIINIIAREVNQFHRQGVALDGSAGQDFFVKKDETLPFEMGNIDINPGFYDLNKIAASATGESENNSIAISIYELRNEKLLSASNINTDMDDYYNSVITWIGIKGQEQGNYIDNQNTLIRQTDDRRSSISNVSMDEEMTNMMKYQHAYNASAKVFSTIDSMIDNIINKMGRVGQ